MVISTSTSDLHLKNWLLIPILKEIVTFDSTTDVINHSEAGFSVNITALCKLIFFRNAQPRCRLMNIFFQAFAKVKMTGKSVFRPPWMPKPWRLSAKLNPSNDHQLQFNLQAKRLTSKKLHENATNRLFFADAADVTTSGFQRLIQASTRPLIPPPLPPPPPPLPPPWHHLFLGEFCQRWKSRILSSRSQVILSLINRPWMKWMNHWFLSEIR